MTGNQFNCQLGIYLALFKVHTSLWEFRYEQQLNYIYYSEDNVDAFLWYQIWFLLQYYVDI